MQLSKLGGLRSLELTMEFADPASVDVRPIAHMLVKSPRLRRLHLSAVCDDGTDEYLTAQQKTVMNSFLSLVCKEYASLKASELPASVMQIEASRKSSRESIAQLALVELRLFDQCLLGPEIKLLTNTSALQILQLSNRSLYGHENPYEGNPGALNILACCAPNLRSLLYNGEFKHHIDGVDIDFKRDFPSLVELALFGMNSGTDFVESMTVCQGTATDAKRWKRLTLGLSETWEGVWTDPTLFPPLLDFVQKCESLTHLLLHVSYPHWVCLSPHCRNMLALLLIMERNDFSL